ncbi:MAG: hypothetical protein ABI577_09215 [bacterium]
MSDLIDQLIANPGLYSGTQADPTASHPSGSVARIVVTPLPGGAGVAMDYEVLSPENGRVHNEHSVLARTPGGVLLMVSHSHADRASVLHEAEPGYFPARDGEATFPMAIRLEVPAPGQLVYSWSYGTPGEQLVVRDVGTMTRV